MCGKKIKILLLQHDVKQADIARKLNVSRTAIHHVISGTSESRRIKSAIAKALKMRVGDLWPNNDHKHKV